MGQAQPSWDVLSDVQQLIHFHFMQNALLAGTMVALAAGVIGYFVVLRGQSFASHTLSQVGFPGAAAALLLGLSPQVGLVAFCLSAAIGIGLLPRLIGGGYRSESGAIGVILVFSASWGGRIPFLGRLPGDIHIQRDNWSFYFPLTTSILVSLLLTLILTFLSRR